MNESVNGKNIAELWFEGDWTPVQLFSGENFYYIERNRPALERILDDTSSPKVLNDLTL